MDDLGGEWRESPRDAAERADAVMCAIPGAPEVRDVFEGEDGLGDALESEQLVVGTSTIGPDAAEALAELCADRGARFPTAPLTRNAPAGGVHMIVGGTEDDYEAGTALLDATSRRHARMGIARRGPDVQVDYAGALRLSGGRRRRDRGVRAGSGTRSATLPGVPRPRRRRAVPDPRLRAGHRGNGGLAIWHKDLRYGLEVAREDGTATPILNAVFEAYKRGVRAAGDDEGHAASVLRYWETLGGNGE